MRIDLLVVPDCPHRGTTRKRVVAALALAGRRAAIHEVEVTTAADADRLGMRGSPTVLIDGRDAFDGGETSLSCRLYGAPNGVGGLPTVEQLIEVLARDLHWRAPEVTDNG